MTLMAATQGRHRKAQGDIINAAMMASKGIICYLIEEQEHQWKQWACEQGEGIVRWNVGEGFAIVECNGWPVSLLIKQVVEWYYREICYYVPWA